VKHYIDDESVKIRAKVGKALANHGGDRGMINESSFEQE